MATVITKKNSTSGVVPIASNLQVGELAVNTADGRLFTKHTDNSIKEVGIDNWTMYEFDIGTNPRRQFSFTVTNAKCTPSSLVQVIACGEPATGRGIDDFEWDMGMFTANAFSGYFVVTAFFTGKIVGKRNIQYRLQ